MEGADSAALLQQADTALRGLLADADGCRVPKDDTREQDALALLRRLRHVLLGEAGRGQLQVAGEGPGLPLAGSNSGAGPEQGEAGQAVDAAASAAEECGFLETLVLALPALSWDGRKEASLVWACLLPHVGPRLGPSPGSASAADSAAEESESLALRFVEQRMGLVDRLVQGYEGSSDMALPSGLMLRETLRSEKIARHVLESSGLDTVVLASDVPNFDVASDAFNTLKDLLRRHKACVASFLADNFTRFVTLYHHLLLSDTYVTRRQALKLLGEILLDRSNISVMLQYISEPNNLKLIMTLLKDPSKSIQFEAFHVFKVFVANPKRPEGITKLLSRNQAKLLLFLRDFKIEKDEEDFEQEKEVLIESLQDLGLT